MRTLRARLSHVLLCATPLLAIGVAAFRDLRVAGVYQMVGGVLFIAIFAAMWTLGARSIRADAQEEQRQLALAGVLLVAPFALIALFWVGLGTPWEATAQENQMRYLTLIAMAIAEVIGFAMGKEALAAADERFYPTLACGAMVLAGPLYIVWDTVMFGLFSARALTGETPTVFESLNRAADMLLDLAEILTYLAATALAVALGRAQWLGRTAARVFVILNAVALVLLVDREFALPNPAALSTPWYTVPGFIVGIPAVPYIMPLLLGVVLLRRASEEAS